MSKKFDKFTAELDDLIKQGDSLHMAIQYDCLPDEFREKACENLGEQGAETFIKGLPDFKEEYQAWYSEAQAVIKQVFPERLSDFRNYFEFPRVRKDITFQNYMIKDYLQGLSITRGSAWEKQVIADGSAAIPEFRQQLSIVKAAREKLTSSLLNLKLILQAHLFDSEISGARSLAKNGFLRAAGAICGVIIEKHLHQTLESHSVSSRKKHPGISDLNQVLKDNDVIDVPQWRFIQHLADIRNLCDHAKGREPKAEEIDDLLSGVEKVLKTVF
ncbi:hypothetical protein SAMN04488020_108144 [Palleronia marisminoris]|uniref:DUF4145 domain-containing protein n=1 Tax=Palleronia marisminoris TaxID=315423 RepID=A0A1Y5T9G3_9RHOB|nr:hypothetical protein [Palleronia marisminoris]SFH23500.1 hypothetical protein SAMN04488020_108144 [Palleronia marisminoris]SLN58459.1 hypothetical protein PAM7066_02852 [Palleronia marisminoris]